jgi:hypothetical protein
MAEQAAVFRKRSGPWAYKRERCGAWLPRAREYCGKPAAHKGPHCSRTAYARLLEAPRG